MMASMRNWLAEKVGRVVVVHCKGGHVLVFVVLWGQMRLSWSGWNRPFAIQKLICLSIAGKGRSGTAACSFLISERGWEPAAALTRFTERRMRAGFGQGVSIPSQVRWMTYVDRWLQNGKKYVERSIEILEVHMWGLRDGVKVAVEGFVDEGRTIKTFHVFGPDERVVMTDPVGDGDDLTPSASSSTYSSATSSPSSSPPAAEQIRSVRRNSTEALDRIGSSASNSSTHRAVGVRRSPSPRAPTTVKSSELDEAKRLEEEKKKKKKKKENLSQAAGTEPGGSAVLLKPSPGTRIILPSNDVNVAIERRTPVFSKTLSSSSGWQVVTAVAHVWFNTYFENRRGCASRLSPTSSKELNRSDDHSNSITASNSPAAARVRNAKDSPSGTSFEKDRSTSEETTASGGAEESASGVFEITWDEMDGIKGTYKRGIRALDRMAVVWRVASTPESGEKRIEQRAASGSTITAPSSTFQGKEQPPSRSSSPRQDHARVKDGLIPEPAPGEEVQDRQPSPAVPVALPSSPASEVPSPILASPSEASEARNSSTSGSLERGQRDPGQQEHGLRHGHTVSIPAASKEDENAGVSQAKHRERTHAAETREHEDEPRREALAPTTTTSSAARTLSSTQPSGSTATSSPAIPPTAIAHPTLVSNEASSSSTDVGDTSDVRTSERSAPEEDGSSRDTRTARSIQHMDEHNSRTTHNTVETTATASTTSGATATLITTSTSPTPASLTDDAGSSKRNSSTINGEITNPAGDKGLHRDVGIRQVPL